MLSRPALPPLRPALGPGVVNRLVPLGLVVVGLLAALICGWATARGSSMLVAPIVGLALYIILAHTTLAPFALIVFGASTFMSAYSLPRTAHFYPVELLVLLGLSLLPFSNSRSFGQGTGVLMIVLFLGVFAGVVVAKGHGIATLDAIDGARPMFLYASFWVALAALRASPRRFFKLIAAFAILIPLLQVTQLVLPGQAIFRSAGEAFVTPQPGGYTRVNPPGLVLVYFTLIFSLCYLLWGPPRARRAVAAFAAVGVVGILISLNRNMMLGIVLGLVVALAVNRRRGRALTMFAAGAALIAVALSFAGSGAIGSRILSLGSPSGLQASTLSDREYENSFAVPVIERHPIFGIGWAVSYGAYLSAPGTGNLSQRGFIHNQYYGLMLRTGIVGLLAFVGLLFATASVGLRWSRRGIPDEDWVGSALLASVVAFASSAIVGIYVIDPGSAPDLAVLFAFGVLLRERLKRGENLGVTTPFPTEAG